jgi:ceramide glucosyltransferase
VRVAASFQWLNGPSPKTGRADDVTILQPILSGDPALERCLRANLEANPTAQFLLLVDEDDPTAREIAGRLARPNVRVLIGPPPADGENPKSAKLARALAHVGTPLFAVLDDDTMLPAGGAARAAGVLAQGDLVTGLPFYERGGGFWSDLLAAFVNGAALATYPCAARFGQQRTINGMFYLGRADELRALGGFAAIAGSLTDDYAIAKLYLNAGRRIVQSAIVHPLCTTVTGAAHYASIMRRWMIFALRYVRENRSPFTLGLIGLPTVLAPLIVLAGMITSWTAFLLAFGALAAKAAAMAFLRHRFAADRTGIASIGLEMLADLLTPLHLIAALARPNAFRWRSRAMRMDRERIRYADDRS